MLFTPIPSLTLRPGVRLFKADVEALENGVVQPAITLRTKTAWPELSFGYQPSKIFSVRGDVHAYDNGSSYTAITPHTEVAGHLIFRFQPYKKVTLQDDLNLTNDKLIDSSFQDNVHSNTVTLSYALNDRFSIFGGYTYDSVFAAGNIVYARGTAPLDDFLRDQEADRVMQAGVEAKPSKYFGFQLTGNFDRSTGLGQISGEPPAYGPLTWPLVTGTVYVNFPKAGRLSVDLATHLLYRADHHRQQFPGESPHPPLDARLLAVVHCEGVNPHISPRWDALGGRRERRRFSPAEIAAPALC